MKFTLGKTRTKVDWLCTLKKLELEMVYVKSWFKEIKYTGWISY
jgi:hypothetical protein